MHGRFNDDYNVDKTKLSKRKCVYNVLQRCVSVKYVDYCVFIITSCSCVVKKCGKLYCLFFVV